MHQVDSVSSLSTIPVVKIGMAMMYLSQERSVPTLVNIEVHRLLSNVLCSSTL